MPTFKRTFTFAFDEVIEKTTAALKTQGFGVLTEINIDATLKKKIDVDFRRYQILGACNPPLAHRALQNDLDVGVLLPCNVVVYEADDKSVVVSVVDPAAAIGSFGDKELQEIAEEVSTKLKTALDAVAPGGAA
ncbi:MAG: DUF302 domain-containing protein [Deltaproteobacteria bacterium]|nr:DUF302 domain-containing protein [Deltaproteobacteria bacterium]